MQYGRLTVLSTTHGPDGKARFFVRCSCGTEKLARAALVKSGRIQSCGCLLREFRARRTEEARSRQREYQGGGFLTYNGQTLSVAAWARKQGLNKLTLYGRLWNGWTIEHALTIPVLR